MARPITEVIHRGRLEIRRNNERFGTLWIEKGNVWWRTWVEFDQFMTRSGKFSE